MLVLDKTSFYNGNINAEGTKIINQDGSWVELIDYMGTDYRVVQAARVSYGIDDRSKGYEKDFDLLKYLMEAGHLGPFEHVSATFRIYTPLFVSKQWMRHRTQSFNEISRRYTKYGIEFWLPDENRLKDEEALDAMKSVYEHAKDVYDFLLNTKKVPKEIARAVLPAALFTKFYATANLRNWLHFLDLRTDEHAQYEIRELAISIQELLEMLFPHTMYLWKNSKTRGAW